MEELKQMIAAWVREARRNAKLSQEALGIKLALELSAERGYTKANISHWENSRNEPNLQQLIAIAKVTNTQLPKVLLSSMQIGEGVGAILGENDGAVISERIDALRQQSVLAGNSDYMPISQSGDNDDVEIQMGALSVSAGIDGFQVAQEPGEARMTMRIDRHFVESKGYDPAKLVGVKVRGESMAPKLSDGDTVIINTAEIKPVDGQVYAVNYEGEAVIKRLSRDAGEWWLTSDNPDQRKYHRKLCRGGECIIVGRAVRAFTDNL